MLTSCNDSGTAYIETSTLDGEKNLKPRQSLAATSGLNDRSNFDFSFKIECENPNPKIYHFLGNIEINNQKHSLDKTQLLLGGAYLRNTPSVIGVAIYTGPDTKLRQNLMTKTSKQSKIEAKVNKYILFILFFQFLMCVAAGLGSKNFISSEASSKKYLRGLDYSANVQGLLTYFTYFLLLNTMLPISLIISLELIKVAQGYFMQNDIEMYSVIRDKTCKVSTYTITEELGMIQHIFSDKTGTLTCNRMEFKFCSIGNKIYGDLKFLQDLNFTSEVSYSTREIIFTFNVKEIMNDLFAKSNSSQLLLHSIKGYKRDILYQHDLVAWFVRCMALCHECMIDEEEGDIKYIGQSPDEITLVDAARHIGFEYNSIKNGVISLVIKSFGQQFVEKYEKVCLIEFDSDRKRNSIVVKNVENNEIFIFVKGADNVIKSRLHRNNSKEYLNKINADLLEFSNRRLRTLMLALRHIDNNEFLD